MMDTDEVSRRVQKCLRKFLDSSGRKDQAISGQTNLHTGFGFSSDEGLDLVLELCDEFNYEFPNDFNPVIHRDGKRGNSVNELTAAVSHYLANAKASA